MCIGNTQVFNNGELIICSIFFNHKLNNIEIAFISCAMRWEAITRGSATIGSLALTIWSAKKTPRLHC